MTARNYFFVEQENKFRPILPALLISAVSHVLIAVIFLYAPGRHMDRRIITPINVSLVSIPGPYRGPLPAKGKPAEKRVKKPASAKPKILPKVEQKAEEPKPVVEPKPTPDVKKVVVPEATPKTSLKKKTFKTGEVVKSVPKEKEVEENKSDSLAKALKEMEKKVERGQPDSLEKALERMKEKVDAQAKTRKDQGAEEDAGNEGTADGGGGSGNPGELSPIDQYKLEIMVIIENNWAFSPQLAGRLVDLESVLIIKVMPNGEIKDIWYEKKSGSPYMDESAQKAILKSDPLPPLPSGFTGPFLTVGIVFTPTGITQ